MAKPKLPDRYHVIAELGSGGMGTVYKVKDTVLDKTFAIKILTLDFSQTPNGALRFQKEAKSAGKLKHDHIIKIIDFGVTGESVPYMVLEYFDGLTLKDWIKRNGRLNEHAAINLFQQLLNAVDYAHLQGIVHRDLKSNNIMVKEAEDGFLVAKLFDFGIAQIAESTASMNLTATNAVIGTPSYMSPEQARGKKVDKRSDIYSLGCIMFECLTGRLPFKSDNTLDLLHQHSNNQPPKLGELVPELQDHPLETVVDKCLEKEPDARYATAHDIMLALNSEDGREATDERITEPKRKNSVAIVLLGVLVTLVLTILAISVGQPLLKDSEDTKHSKPEPNIFNEVAGYESLALKHEAARGTIRLNAEDADDYLMNCKPNRNIKALLSEQLASVSDNGWAQLTKFPNLELIKTGHNTITADSIRCFKNNHRLHTLVMLHSTISDKDFETVGELASLTDINVQNLNKSKLETILKLPRIRQIYGTNFDLSADSIRKIASKQTVALISADGCSQIDVNALSKLKNLSTLSLKKVSQISANNGAGIRAITQLPNLRTLTLEDCNLEDAHCKTLAKMNSLTRLSLDSNEGITDTGLRHLKPMSGLLELQAIGCNTTSRGQAEFTKARLPSFKLNCEEKSGTEALFRY